MPVRFTNGMRWRKREKMISKARNQKKIWKARFSARRAARATSAGGSKELAWDMEMAYREKFWYPRPAEGGMQHTRV